MNYTTLERVKTELGTAQATDDALLSLLIEGASRAFDRKCTGVMDAVDYFKLETVTGEIGAGQVDYMGRAILCYPKKPIITSITSFAFQENITTQAFTVDAARIEVDGPRVKAYPQTVPVEFPSRCRVTMTYTGGLAASGSALPADLQEMITLLTIRFYREAETGLNDAMGVAELAQMVYTKVWPIRVTEQMQPYVRRVGWRNVA